VEEQAGAATTAATLAGRVRGPAAALVPLSRVRLADSLAEAVRARGTLADGQSFIALDGEWVGRDWLRVSRGADPRAGVLGREQRLKGLRIAANAASERVTQSEGALSRAREALTHAEAER